MTRPLLAMLTALSTIVLAGCQSTPVATAPSSPVAPSTGTPDKADVGHLTAKESPAALGDDLIMFTSPSGNVGCALDVDYARCDIADRDWTPPPRPADCEFDYGQGIALAPDEPAGFVCAGDTTLGGPEVLDYGRSIERGSFRCDSAESGITCRDRRTGAGFSLAREVYQLF